METTNGIGGTFDRIRRLGQVKQDYDRLVTHAVEGSGNARPRVVPAVEEARNLFMTLAEGVEADLRRKTEALRRAQVIEVEAGRGEGGPGYVVLHVDNGEIIHLRVHDPGLAARMTPGATALLTRGHEEVVDVDPAPPPFLDVGRLARVEPVHGVVRVDVAAEAGGLERGMRVHPGVDPADLVPGRKVHYKGRFVYAVQKEDVPALAERHRVVRPFGVAAEDVVGRHQRALLGRLTALLDVHLHPDWFPPRVRDAERRVLVSGRPGVGKSHTLRCFFDRVLERVPGARLYAMAASAFTHGIVGESERSLRDVLAYWAEVSREGFTVAVVEEATPLLRARDQSARLLDGGVGLASTETLLAALDSLAAAPPGNLVLAFTSNLPQLVDRAARRRLVGVPVDTFTGEEFVEVLRGHARREGAVYGGSFTADHEEAVRAALESPIGTVAVGKDLARPVRVRHVVTGSLATTAHQQSAHVVDRSIAAARGPDGATFPRISPALLHTQVVCQAWQDLAGWTEDEARRAFEGSDLLPVGQARALTGVGATDEGELRIAEAWDAREGIGEILGGEG